MEKVYDVIIIGGGPAGITAAISAKRKYPNYSVCIIDRTFALGRKLMISGAGRCNVTNINLDNDYTKHYYGSTIEFIGATFKQFSYKDIVGFLNDLGIELYVERKTTIGKVFPTTDQAQTVVDLLIDELKLLGVDIFLNCECKQVIKKTDNFEINSVQSSRESKETQNITFKSKYLIMSAGGKVYPSFGSDGSGYPLLENFGHKLVKPVPSALSVEGKNQLSQLLQRSKFEIEATSIIEGKEIKTSTDDVMFKDYGLSGPAILNISREISIHINREAKNNAYIKLNFFPGLNRDQVLNKLKDRWSKRPSQSVEKSLYGFFPNKFCTAVLKVSGINIEKKVKDLQDNEINILVNNLTKYNIKITGTRGWNEAEFTAGGIDTKDIKIGTLESKLVDNLYLAGEICDVDGDVGGFNLSWAWSSGFVAGLLN